MLEILARWRAVWACGPRSERKSSMYCGELPAPQAPASSSALANVYEASVYHPLVNRFSHLAWRALYHEAPRVAPTVICDHCGYGRFAAILPSTPNGVWLSEYSDNRRSPRFPT